MIQYQLCLTQAGIAQSVEHFTRNEGVEGSSPFSSFNMFKIKNYRPEKGGFFVLFLSCKGNLKRNIQNNSRETSKKLRNEAHHTVCEIVNDNWKEVYAGLVTSERLNNFGCKQTVAPPLLL